MPRVMLRGSFSILLQVVALMFITACCAAQGAHDYGDGSQIHGLGKQILIVGFFGVGMLVCVPALAVMSAKDLFHKGHKKFPFAGTIGVVELTALAAALVYAEHVGPSNDPTSTRTIGVAISVVVPIAGIVLFAITMTHQFERRRQPAPARAQGHGTATAMQEEHHMESDDDTAEFAIGGFRGEPDLA